jgi:hypothetical protein
MTTHELRTTRVSAGKGAASLGSLQHLGAASGLVGFALAIGAIVVGAATGTVAANPGASADEIARAYGTLASPLVWVGAALQILALLCLFGFATYLAEAEQTDWLSGLTAGAGRTFVTLTLAGFAIGSVARFRAGPGLDVTAAMVLFDIHVALYVASWAVGALFMGAVAVLGLRSRTLPGWLCVAAACIAAVNLAAVALPTTPLASFPNLLIWLWTLAASVYLVFWSVRVTEGVRP